MCKTKVLFKIVLDFLRSFANISTCNRKEWFAGVISDTFGGRSLANLVDTSPVSNACEEDTSDL